MGSLEIVGIPDVEETGDPKRSRLLTLTADRRYGRLKLNLYWQ